MRILFFVVLITFCALKLEAFIVHQSDIIQRIYNKDCYHADYPKYFDFSDLILNEDESPLPSALWCYNENNFFEGVNDISLLKINILIGEDDRRYAVLFERADDRSKYFSLDQLKYSENDQLLIGAVVTKMKTELNAILGADDSDPTSTLKSLEEQIHNIEQTPYLYDALYADEVMNEGENGEGEDAEENGIEQYVMPNFLQEHLDGLKAQRDSLTEFTQQLLSLD